MAWGCVGAACLRIRIPPDAPPPGEARGPQLGGKHTSLLISNEKAALEQCVRSLIEREKQDESRKQNALQEWAMLAAQVHRPNPKPETLPMPAPSCGTSHGCSAPSRD
jgi:hypothetical protein